MKKKLIIAILIPFLFLTGCNTDEPPSEEDYIIGETTVVLDENDVMEEIEEIEAVDGDPANGYIFTVPSTSSLASDLESGDILACGVSEKLPDGFLQKIVSIETISGSTEFHTVPAALNEAFEKLHLDQTFELDPGKITESIPLIDGVTFSPGKPSDSSKSSINYNYGIDAILAQEGDGVVTATGEISIGISSHVIIDINSCTPSQIGYSVNFDESVNLEVAATYDTFIDTDIPLYKHKFKPIIIWVVIPITFKPIVTFSVGIDGTITASASAGIEQSAHLDSSLIWSSATKKWAFEQDRSSNFTPIYPSAEASCSVKVTAGPILDVLLYGIVGPYVRAGGYLILNVDLSTAPPPLPWLTLDAGLEAAIGINLIPFVDALNAVNISINGREEYVIPIIEERILELPNTDLLAKNLTIIPGGPYADGQTLTIQAQVENLSSLYISNEIPVRWEIYEFLTTFSLIDTIDQTISSLAANTTTDITHPWTIPSIGGTMYYRIVFILDPDNTLYEFDEDNNEVYVDIEVP